MKVRYDENGIHFFDRRTGANLLIDELSVEPSQWAKSPRHVSFALTNSCDLRCGYCYAPKHRAELDFERLKSWITDIDRNGSLGVGFGGGEPTIYKDFVELCKYTSTQTSLSVSFTTHGHRVAASMAEQLSGHVHFIRVSMDGLGATYERLRGRSFEQFLSAISILRTIAPFGINYVLNADTVHELKEAIVYAQNLGAREFLILPEIDKNGGFHPSHLKYLRDFLTDYRGNLPLRINENCTDGMPVADPFKDLDPINAYAFVDARGILKRTSYELGGVDISQGNILYGLEIMRSQLIN
ncbi:hypothetical protein GCM10023091_00180 [Ravibacter arvi]|uniref:Radical SAM core domain-containing protein n=1 Tax=Ravibacter arvi TaxID=2051041 RepID=A0ABP8LLH2_9BACT